MRTLQLTLEHYELMQARICPKCYRDRQANEHKGMPTDLKLYGCIHCEQVNIVYHGDGTIAQWWIDMGYGK